MQFLLEYRWWIIAAVAAAYVLWKLYEAGMFKGWKVPTTGKPAPLKSDLDLLLDVLSRAKGRAGERTALVGSTVGPNPIQEQSKQTADALMRAVESLLKEITA